MNHKIKTLQDKKRQAYSDWKGVMDAAKAAGDRALTSEESRIADEAETTIDDCNDKIEAERTGGSYGSREAKLAAIGSQLERDSRSPRGQLQRIGGPRGQDRPNQSFAYKNLRTDEWVTAVGHGEPLLGDSGDTFGELGEQVVGMATGRYSSMTTQAAVRENSDPSGGYIVPTRLASNIIDTARAQMRMSQAGMRTIDFGDGNELKIGKITADPSVYWRQEGGTITASRPTFGFIRLIPKVCACLIPVSLEWLEDVSNGAALLEQVMTQALAVELDRAILRGDGGGAELQGIRYTDDVQLNAVGGAWNLDTIVDNMEDIWDENGPFPTACILSPASEAYRRKCKDGNGQYLFAQPNPTNDLPFLPTTSCPSDEIYVGDFTRVLLAVKNSLRVEVLDAGTGSDSDGTSYNATTQMYKWIRCYLRADCHIELAKHMVVNTGVTQ